MRGRVERDSLLWRPPTRPPCPPLALIHPTSPPHVWEEALREAQLVHQPRVGEVDEPAAAHEGAAPQRLHRPVTVVGGAAGRRWVG